MSAAVHPPPPIPRALQLFGNPRRRPNPPLFPSRGETLAGKSSPYGGADASHLAEACSSRRARGVFLVRRAVGGGGNGQPGPYQQDRSGGRRPATPVGNEL